MTTTTDQLAEVRRHLDKAASFDHLARFDWRRQTDCVQQAFITARLFVDCGPAAVFVDGHINDFVKVKALNGVIVESVPNRTLSEKRRVFRLLGRPHKSPLDN